MTGPFATYTRRIVPVHRPVCLITPPSYSVPTPRLGLLLGRCLCLGRLLLVAADHHDANEGAHHRRPQERKENRDANRPNTGGKKVLERMAGVNERLYGELAVGSS